MNKSRALIVGMGISGLATAMRLHEIGWEPVIVERAAGRRAAGYFIALFGTGLATAQRMDVLDAIGHRDDPTTLRYDIDRKGSRRPNPDFEDVPGSPRVILRGDIEAAFHDTVAPRTEIRYGTTPVALEEHADAVNVTLRTTTEGNTTETTERFDLVVGADGLRSTVRRLVFGPDTQYMKPMNHIIAAAFLKEQVPGLRQQDGLTFCEPGRSAWVFPFANHQPGLLVSYRTHDEDAQFRRPPAESLRRAFGPEPTGPVLEHLFQQFEDADDFLFDSTHQIIMPTWHTDRVVLVGDAAWCMTLYSGMGASTGMAGADLLGTVLQRNPGQLPRALREWEQRLRPFITTEQKSALTVGLQMFVPQTRRDIALGRITQKLTGNPVTARVMRTVMANALKHKSIDIAAP
ncbi:FAD-dependent monooxygenase [Streptomyces xiamenensis]|uniref:FAD-dependent monooxygenase n=1 Tax=Streptomyces xiamenensis TaxID=408015 RepID=UPI00341729B2